MKIIKITILFTVLVTTVHAQQDYKALLNTLYKNSENGFKDISGPVNDTSSFVDCSIKPSVGEIKIQKTSFAVILNWEVPLAKSAKVRADVQGFMKATYADTQKYKTAADGSEEEGEIWTNVYELRGNEKPLIVFKTIYYKNTEDPQKSKFTITIYGK